MEEGRRERERGREGCGEGEADDVKRFKSFRTPCEGRRGATRIRFVFLSGQDVIVSAPPLPLPHPVIL